MSRQLNFLDSLSATSSPASASGATPSGAPAGPTTAPSGPAPARASLSARQAAELGLTTSGTFGLSGTGSSASVALQSSLGSRLRRLTASRGSTLYLLTWKERITPSGLLISALRASERPTSANGSGSWPTPQARDWKGADLAGVHDRGTKGPPLNEVVRMASWPTPVGEDAESSRPSNRRIAAGKIDTLTFASEMAGWPTPVAKDDNKTPEAHLAMKQRMGERDGTGANRTAITSLQVMSKMAGWTSPKVSDETTEALESRQAREARHQAEGKTKGIGGLPLPTQAQLSGWPTPVVNDEKGSQYAYSQGNHDKPVLKLPGAAMQAGWPTPNTPSGGRSMSIEKMDPTGRTEDGRKHTASLEHAVKFATGPARLTASGELLTGSAAGMASGGQLAPSHSRWLMGLPMAWDLCAIKAWRNLKRK
jgi:hypothetical protein